MNRTTTSPGIRRSSGTRAVPVKTALKSLVPVVAQQLQPKIISTGSRVQSKSTNGRDMFLALLMAVGLSTVFLSPLRLATVTTDVPESVAKPGRVLGESVVVTLRVPVSIRLNGQEWKISTAPKYGLLAEVLGQAASAVGTSFEYTSRGSSIYLQRYFKIPDDVTGSWVVSVNGVAVTDLSSRLLEQGDEVRVTWTPL